AAVRRPRCWSRKAHLRFRSLKKKRWTYMRLMHTNTYYYCYFFLTHYPLMGLSTQVHSWLTDMYSSRVMLKFALKFHFGNQSINQSTCLLVVNYKEIVTNIAT